MLASYISHVIERELEHQEAAARAEAWNKTRDLFLAEVAHELRGPLNAILGWTKLLRKGNLGVEQAANAAEVIEHSAQLQSHIIEDLLDVSRAILGNLRLNMQPVSLSLIAEAVVEKVRPTADVKGLQLDLTITPSRVAVLGDSLRLEQVLSNLLTNAIKFTPKGARIKMCVNQTEAHAMVSVSDTGSGISPELLPYIFDPFRQGGDASAGRGRGLGLGLAIARQLVHLHGGTIQAESKGFGCGSTFTVTLPTMNDKDC